MGRQSELDGDALRWCDHVPQGLKRPKAFKAEAESGILILTLKRVKADE